MAATGPETITLRDPIDVTRAAGAGRVVVGYDGRWQAPVVLDFAADIAARSKCPLSVVTLFRSPGDVACFEDRPADGWHPQSVIRRRLDAAASRVRERHPLLRVAVHGLLFDDVSREDEPFCSARLLVLGERGAREPGGRPGSTSRTASSVLRAAVTCDVVEVQEAEVSVP